MTTPPQTWDTLNAVYPITHYRISTDNTQIELKRTCLRRYRPELEVQRGNITKLSRKSLLRLAFLGRLSTGLFKSMLTLTYAKIERDGKGVKSDLAKVLKFLRARFKRVEYLWFLEFQKRGAPHYHILLSENVSRETLSELSRLWCRTQGLRGDEYLKAYNVTNHKNSWQDLKKADGAGRYVAKYANKPEQKNIPEAYQNVGRFWGTSRGLTIGLLEKWQQTHESEIKAILYDGKSGVETWGFYPKYIWL